MIKLYPWVQVDSKSKISNTNHLHKVYSQVHTGRKDYTQPHSKHKYEKSYINENRQGLTEQRETTNEN